MIHNIISNAKKRWWIAFPLLFFLWLIYVWWNCDHWPNSNCTAFEGKTVWEVLELLIIPATLAIVAAYLDKLERKADREISKDNQREVALQNYFDAMTILILDKGLRNSLPGNEVAEIAQVKTISTLERLDTDRKRKLVIFLSSLGLIIGQKGTDPIIKLARTNLSEVNLSGTNLDFSNLDFSNLDDENLDDAIHEIVFYRGTNLIGANLEGTSLIEANLMKVNLEGANLDHAHLEGSFMRGTLLTNARLKSAHLKNAFLRSAHLEGADFTDATMPDGKKYDPAIHTIEMLSGLQQG
jgi:uncharacterized protein YjbI with pentapeptide repeats